MYVCIYIYIYIISPRISRSTLKKMCAPTVPCTAVLAGGAHNIQEVQHVILIRGYIRALPLRVARQGAGKEETGRMNENQKT
jgi:hypothetical protein